MRSVQHRSGPAPTPFVCADRSWSIATGAPDLNGVGAATQDIPAPFPVVVLARQSPVAWLVDDLRAEPADRARATLFLARVPEDLRAARVDLEPQPAADSGVPPFSNGKPIVGERGKR
jgi:hypothetical protein